MRISPITFSIFNITREGWSFSCIKVNNEREMKSGNQFQEEVIADHIINVKMILPDTHRDPSLLLRRNSKLARWRSSPSSSSPGSVGIFFKDINLIKINTTASWMDMWLAVLVTRPMIKHYNSFLSVGKIQKSILVT